MKKAFVSSLFVRYLISYTIAFVIPVLVLGFIMYKASSRIIKDQVDEYSYEMLNSTRESIDSRLEELNRIAVQISNISELRQVKYVQDIYSVRSAIQNIHNLKVANSFIHECFLYYRNSDIIYSSSGTYRLEHFLDLIYHYESWDYQRFIKDINSIDRITVRPPENISLYSDTNSNERFVTYIVPIPYGGTASDGIVFFNINEKEFRRLVLKVLPTPNSLVFVYDGSDQPLIASAARDSIRESIQNIIQNEKSFSSQRVYWDGIEYSASAIKSKTTGWTYVVAVPVHEIAEKMQSVTTTAMIVFIVVVLAGAGIILMLTRVNYKPIKELTRFALKKADFAAKRDFNELDSVKQAVSNMNNMIDTLQQKVEYTVPVMKKTYITRLIQGYYVDFDIASSQASDFEINMPQGSYCVAMCLLSTRENSKIIEFTTAIEASNSCGFIVYALEQLDEARIVLLIINPNKANSSPDEAIYSLIVGLRDSLALNMGVGIGKWVDSISEIKNSYIQASTALDYRFIKEATAITFFKVLEKKIPYGYYDPNQQSELLEMQILHGNIEEVRKTLAIMFEDIKGRELPIFQVRTFFYNFINSVLNSSHKKDPTLHEYQYLDIIALINTDTIEDLQKKIEEMCLSICSAIHDRINEANAGRIKEMLDYINQHYSSPSFSIQVMASEFGMSPSAFSTYFKSKTNENALDYINKLRIQKAKKLLEETNITLQEIVQEVGYFNVSSFIRKFKHYTKVTPGIYRELLK